MQTSFNGRDHSRKLLLDLEVPVAIGLPAEISQLCIHTVIASHIAGDLLVPIGARPARLMPRGVPMPESAIDEDCDA
jgi:hypothetical protein